jgi:radical SAM protein with 4Fe4S-binding SPASM domain
MVKKREVILTIARYQLTGNRYLDDVLIFSENLYLNIRKGIHKLNPKNKNQFGFQWHITNRCNLRCIHCYQEDYSGSNELDFNGLKRIADEIVATLAEWEKKGDIAITGGEPLLKQEAFPLIDYLESFDEIASVDVLSNGTLINERIVEKLVKLSKLRCVQISLDGASAESNDEIRGKGAFEKALTGIRLLRKNGIQVNVMFTLNRKNVKDVGPIIDLAAQEDIAFLTIERFVPTGAGSKISKEMLSPKEIETTFNYISERAKQEIRMKGSTSITRSRPLWVLCGKSYSTQEINVTDQIGGICSVGLDGLCILPDATVLPCRRLPIPIGNLNKDSLLKIWHTSRLLWEVADKSNLKGKCKSCEFISKCSGCRAMAYAFSGDYLAEDPQCFKA